MAKAGWHPAYWLLAAFAVVLSACQSPVVSATGNLDHILENQALSPDVAALVIYRLEDERVWTSSGDRPAERFVAASTSKIPHTLIALETGAVSGPDELFEWDGEVRFVPGWNESQDFATAFRRSTVWIYQTITPRIGSATLGDWLAKFDFGNANTGGADDIQTYWLKGPLEISAHEQIGFLAKLAARTLPLSAETYTQALPIMLEKSGEGWTLYGKTGWKSVKGETDIGWYVGWLEQTAGEAPGTYAFALNMNMRGDNPPLQKRRAAVHEALIAIGALEAPADP